MTLPLASRFFTFYSFKGGVGRSMAVLNCAYVLAGAGRRVLMIDFDLEAPGLSLLINRGVGAERGPGGETGQRADPPLHTARGLIELITDFAKSPSNWALGGANSAEQLQQYITDLTIPDGVRALDSNGRLALIPAGRIDDSYAARLHQIHWKRPPLAKHRDDLFRHLRKLIEQYAAFDYVLIDSRTGWSDEGYLSTRILADHLIVLTGLNDQNIDGTADFLKSVETWPAEKDRVKKRRVVLVESPVPEWEDQAKRKRHEEIQEFFRCRLGDPIPFSHALPYHPLMALHEEAMVAHWPDTSLSRAYRGLTRIIQQLAEDEIERWIQQAFEALGGKPHAADTEPKAPDLEMVRQALENLRMIDRSVFAAVAQAVVSVLSGWSKPMAGDVELLGYLARYLPDEPSYLRHLARLQRTHKDIPAARQAIEKAAEVAEQREDLSELTLIEIERGDLEQNAYDPVRAREAFDRALNAARQLKDLRGISSILYRLAELDRLQGNYEAARQGCNQALEINQSLGNRRGIAVTLHALAELDRQQGNYEAARQRFNQALEINQSLGNRRGIAANNLYRQAVEVLSGNQHSIDQLADAAEAAAAIGDPYLTARGLVLLAEGMQKLGDADGALDKLREAATLAKQHGLAGLEADANAAIALILAERDDAAAAAEHAQAAVKFFEAQTVTHRDRPVLDRLLKEEGRR